MNPTQLSIDLLAVDEGFDPWPYVDTEGYPTWGYGFKIGYKLQPIEDFAYLPTMPEPVGHAWLVEKVADLVQEIQENSITREVYEAAGDAVRKAVIISMCYQLGQHGFRQFKNTIDCILMEDYDGAANEMLDSKWARTQTPNRAERMADMMRFGEIDDYYLRN